MSRTIARPWIVDAVTSHAPLPSMPSAQVIGFEDTTVADSEDTQRREQIVGRMSDKQVWIYAIFTVDAIASFEVRLGGETHRTGILPTHLGCGTYPMRWYLISHLCAFG